MASTTYGYGDYALSLANDKGKVLFTKIDNLFSQTFTKLNTDLNSGSTLDIAITGNAATATKLAAAVKIGSADFDGSAAITLAQIGAAAASHTHGKDDILSVNASAITGTISVDNLPGSVDDVMEYASLSAFPEAKDAVDGKIYVAKDTNQIYRWSGSAYVELKDSHANDSEKLVTAKASGLYKFATTAEGHIKTVTAVEKSDITALGIPAQDTTYEEATTSVAGLMSAEDKAKLDTYNEVGSVSKGIYITSDGVPAEMSYEVLKTVPSDALFSDENLKQTVSTANEKYPLLAAATKDKSSTSTEGAVFAAGITINPSTNTIKATTFDGNASTADVADKLAAGVGSVTQPVYVASDGTVTATSYSLAQSVTADSKLTDTLNTVGSVATTDKIYIVGAGEQTTGVNGTAGKSNSLAYITNGVIYSSNDASSPEAKPVLTQDIAANIYAPLVSPELTGTPKAPTASTGDVSTQIANTGWVAGEIAGAKVSTELTGIPTAPTADTGTDTTQIATTAFVQQEITAAKVSPALSGTPTAPTAAVGTDTTQIATTAFVKAEISSTLSAADAIVYKGTLGTGGTIAELPTDANVKVGWAYKVITAGTYGGQVCEIGDMVIALTAGPNPTWTVVQNNIDGAVTGPATSTADHIATFSGSTGKVVKDSGYTIQTSVPENALFTDQNVAQTKKTSGDYGVVGTTLSADGTAGVVFASNIRINPASGTIVAESFEGTASKATADANGKNIASTYAPLASPALTGTPTAPTAAAGTATTQVATTAFVGTAVSNALVDTALTGTPTAPTASDSTTNTTQIATTAFVQSVVAAMVTKFLTTGAAAGKVLYCYEENSELKYKWEWPGNLNFNVNE